MQRTTRKVLGFVAIAAGIGGGVYLYDQYAKGKKVSGLQVGLPQNPVATAGQVFTLPVSLSNPGAAAVVAAQGTIYAPDGTITGHFWSSAANLASAIAEYGSNPQGYASYSLDPTARVVKAQVAQGGQVTLNLYTDPGAVGSLTFVVWVSVNPTGLLVSDPLGTKIPSAPSGVLGYRGTLQVS